MHFDGSQLALLDGFRDERNSRKRLKRLNGIRIKSFESPFVSRDKPIQHPLIFLCLFDMGGVRTVLKQYPLRASNAVMNGLGDQGRT